jgi:hypothetical protein
MWETVLLWRRWTVPDPLRVDIVAQLVSGRRSMINLLAFWLGGTAAAIGFGLVTLNLLRNSLPALVHDGSSLLSGITGGHVEIVIGVLALLVTAVTAVRLARQRQQSPLAGRGLATLFPQPVTPIATSRLVARVGRLLDGGNPRVGFMAGRNQTTPWVVYLMALSVIVASGAAVGSRLHAGAALIVAILTFVELPLVCYILNPKQTRAIFVPVHNWVRAHRRGFLAVGAGVLGVIMAISCMAGI